MGMVFSESPKRLRHHVPISGGPHLCVSLTGCSPRSHPCSAPRLQEDREQNATSLCDSTPAEVPDPKSRAMSKSVGVSACAQGVCGGFCAPPAWGLPMSCACGLCGSTAPCPQFILPHPGAVLGDPPKNRGQHCWGQCLCGRLALLAARLVLRGAVGRQCATPGANCHRTVTLGCQEPPGELWPSGCPLTRVVGSGRSPGAVGRGHWGLWELLAVLVVPRAGPPGAAGGSWERGWMRCTCSCGAEAVQSTGASIPKAQHVASRRGMGRREQSRGSEDGPDLGRGRCWLHIQGNPVGSESAVRARGGDGGPFLHAWGSRGEGAPRARQPRITPAAPHEARPPLGSLSSSF